MIPSKNFTFVTTRIQCKKTILLFKFNFVASSLLILVYFHQIERSLWQSRINFSFHPVHTLRWSLTLTTDEIFEILHSKNIDVWPSSHLFEVFRITISTCIRTYVHICMYLESRALLRVPRRCRVRTGCFHGNEKESSQVANERPSEPRINQSVVRVQRDCSSDSKYSYDIRFDGGLVFLARSFFFFFDKLKMFRVTEEIEHNRRLSVLLNAILHAFTRFSTTNYHILTHLIK